MPQTHRRKTNIKESIGIVKRHPDGFGFFIPDNMDEPDVYIPRPSMSGIMTNDRVRVSVKREPQGDRFRGEVLEVLSRAISRVMGEYIPETKTTGILRDKSFAWGSDLSVTSVGLSAKEGDLVVVQIESYPDSPQGFSGKIVAVIGDAADAGNDSIRMLFAHSIPNEFTAKTLKEASLLPKEVTEKDWQGREDLRALPIITIDGNTAKDFDDAVHVEKTKNGFHLIVAIADVSHYVRENTAIDEDAYLRGTSTYFPGFVSPMLPEALSNELCSLKPRVPRLALVADMELDHQGTMTGSRFYEAVILSHARVTYGQAQDVIDGQTPESIKHVAENILRCADLARILMQKRFREGSLDLDLPETVVEIDEAGMPVDIMRSERLFAHRLIEELMLMANVAVARFFRDRNIPALYRVHDEPKAEAMANFERFLRAFGYRKRLGGGHLQKKITQALSDFAGHPKEHILNTLALRSLAQAKYSAQNIGHFGLGFSDYVHFTSPIRRYPDLIVHRLLKSALYPRKGYRGMSVEELETAGSVLSACEQRSVKAERQIHSIKKARFLNLHIGEEFEGLISSVTKFGLFVLLRQFEIDGLIRVDELGGGRYDFDEEKLRLVGRKNGKVYEIGDTLQVVVAKADVDAGQIDFVLPEVAKHERAHERTHERVRGRAHERAPEHHQKRKAEKPKGGESFREKFLKSGGGKSGRPQFGKPRKSRKPR